MGSRSFGKVRRVAAGHSRALLGALALFVAAPAGAAGNANDPPDVEGLLANAKSLRRGGRFPEANKELRRALSIAGPPDGERALGVRYELARVLIDQQRF